ncbi:to.2 family protein [Megaselia abdita]
MEKHLVIVILLCSTVAFAEDTIKKCPYEDHKCIEEMATIIMDKFSNGEESIHLENFNPLEVKQLRINTDATNPVYLDLRVTEAVLTGLKGMKISKAKGFGKDLKGPHSLTSTGKAVSLVGKYTANGKVLLLPVRGDGPSNFTFLDPIYTVKFKGEPVEKNGKTYLKVKDFDLKINISRMITRVDNLFNDPILSKEMNKFFNENWSEIYGELRQAINRAMSDHFERVYRGVFDNVPYDELFK